MGRLTAWLRLSVARAVEAQPSGRAASSQPAELSDPSHFTDSAELATQPVVVRGTLLTDYERRLPVEFWTRFLERYRERLLPQLDDTSPFFYPFKRVLFWGAR